MTQDPFMVNIPDILEMAHTQATQGGGRIVVQLAKRKFSKSETQKAVKQLQKAIKLLQPLIGDLPEIK